ncbi:unnamed protein product, partial [marine sediment metagenome]
VNPYAETLLAGAIEQYGPRGTDEYLFQLWQMVPEQYMEGVLAENWKVTADPPGVTFYLRQGIMWTGNTNIGMEPRELIADDVAFHLERLKAKPGNESRYAFVKSITATDRYTVHVEMSEYTANWPMLLGWWIGTAIHPPEVVEADASDWRNAVGTGPFIITNYVEGSACTYERNPNYRGTTTINGKEYQLPFIDELIYPIIPDESTQLAALRTGQVDWMPIIQPIYEDSLTQSSPGLIQSKYLSASVTAWKINAISSEYFCNRNIRRALMIATDLKGIRDSLFPGGEIDGFPLAQGLPAYTPLEELPES